MLVIAKVQGESVRLRTSISDLDWMARSLVNLGCPFTIHAPAALRDRLRHLAIELLNIAGADPA